MDSIADADGIECYEIDRSDFFRQGKVLFAVYEKVGELSDEYSDFRSPLCTLPHRTVFFTLFS